MGQEGLEEEHTYSFILASTSVLDRGV